MKEKITRETVAKISHEKLVELVYQLANRDDLVLDKVVKLSLLQDTKALYKSIMKDIQSIKRGRKFIRYGESFAYARKIEAIVADIETLVKEETEAASLLKALILTDVKVYERSDDSAGAIQRAYQQAEEGWEKRVKSLDAKRLLGDLEEMLICEGFGMRNIISDEIPQEVLLRFYERVYTLYEKEEGFEKSSYHHALLRIARVCKDPERYLRTKQLTGKPLYAFDYIDIAEVYLDAGDDENALLFLKKTTPPQNDLERYYRMLVDIYENRQDSLQVTLAYKEWYQKSRSPAILKAYLARLEGEAKTQAKADALKDVEQMHFSEATYFFYKLDEKALCAEYIMKHRDELHTERLYSKVLNSIIEWLSDEYPQETMLLYRDICEKALASKQSKYYPYGVKALQKMIALEKAHQPIAWKIENNSDYLHNLLKQHQKKSRFVALFQEAFGA